MISDETAYRRYLDGEQKAADLLVERYGDALTLYINGYIKDIHEAEDLMIEAFSQLFAKERPIEGVGSFKAYLYKTARHLAIRHKQKHRLAFLRLDELDFEPQSNTLIDTDLLRSERDRQLYDALEKLKAEYREALYFLHRCSRYDLRGKEILKTQEKFYLADTALRYSVLGYTPDSVASSLENVVYLELCRRGYTVTIGKTPDGEVDFVAQKQNDRLYVQVKQEIKSEKTEKREYERLLEIRDNYPKYVLRTDEFAGGNYQGIKSMHVADFLVGTEY